MVAMNWILSFKTTADDWSYTWKYLENKQYFEKKWIKGVLSVGFNKTSQDIFELVLRKNE